MTPEQRAARSGRRRERRPLYKAIYSFVFGDGDPDAGWDTVEKKAFVAFAQANKGIVTMPEFMALTGLGPLEAEERINRYLYEFEGSPEVTEGGTIYYFFPVPPAEEGQGRPHRRLLGPDAADRPFSSNPKKANATFCVFNGVNLLFGSYFLYGVPRVPALLPDLQRAIRGRLIRRGWDGFYYLHAPALRQASPAWPIPPAFLGIALGVVPLAFSLFFYAIPAIRVAPPRRPQREGAGQENLRRVAYRAVLDSPIPVRPESIPVHDDAARPKDGRAAAKALTRARRLVGRRAPGRRLLLLRRDRAGQGRGRQGPRGRGRVDLRAGRRGLRLRRSGHVSAAPKLAMPSPS